MPFFPSVTSVGTYSGGSSSSHNVPWGTTAAGDLMLLLYTNGQTGAISRPSEFTNTLFSSSFTTGRLVVWAVIADGTETGNVTVSHGSTFAAAQMYRIAAGTWNGTVSTDVLSGTTATGSGTTSNPPNLDTGSSDNYLWIEVAAHDGAFDFGGPSTDFTNLVSTGGSSLELGSARRELAAQSLDPSSWPNGGSYGWAANTLAIRGLPPQLAVDSGSLEITGNAVNFGRLYHMAANAGSGAVSGMAADFALTATRAAADGIAIGGKSVMFLNAGRTARDGFTLGNESIATLGQGRVARDGIVIGSESPAAYGAARYCSQSEVSGAANVVTAGISVSIADGVAPAAGGSVVALRKTAVADGVAVGADGEATGLFRVSGADGASVSAGSVSTVLARLGANDGVALASLVPVTARQRRTVAQSEAVAADGEASLAHGRSVADGVANAQSAAMSLAHGRGGADGVALASAAAETILGLVIANDAAAITSDGGATARHMRAAADSTTDAQFSGIAFAALRAAADGFLAGAYSAVTSEHRRSVGDGTAPTAGSVATVYNRVGVAQSEAIATATDVTAFTQASGADAAAVDGAAPAALLFRRTSSDGLLVAAGVVGVTLRAARVAGDGSSVAAGSAWTHLEARTVADGVAVGSESPATAIQYDPAHATNTLYPSRNTAFVAGKAATSAIWQSDAETIGYEVDWLSWLDGESLSSVVWEITPSTGVTLSGSATSGTIASVTVSGLLSGAVYLLRCRATSSGGRVTDHTLELLCSAGPLTERIADKDSTTRWTWDWSEAMPVGDQVVDAEFTVSSGLTSSAAEFDATQSSVTVAAPGWTGAELIQAVITTASGRVLQSVLLLYLTDL